MPDALVIALCILVGLLVVFGLWVFAVGQREAVTRLRLYWWRLRGSKRAPEIPASAIAVQHPDANAARDALNARLASARTRAIVETTPVVIRPDETPVELSEGDEIVLVGDPNEDPDEDGDDGTSRV